jgi:thioredoxin-related protein
MKILPKYFIRLVGVLLVACGCQAKVEESSSWLTDWEAAKTQAAKEGKHLLINFSGSDWCTWCIRLDREVFSQEAFLAKAKEKFVLVLLDFPEDSSRQSPELKQQNETLQEQFGVEGFPSIYLAKADGTPFAQTGYQDGGPEAYLTHLDGLLAQHAELVKLEAALPQTAGPERAKLLDEICSKMLVDSPRKTEYMTEIVALDADNAAGLKAKYMVLAAMASRASSIRAGKFDDAIAACDKVLAWEGLPADQRQLLLIAKSEVLMNSGDRKTGKALLLEAKQAMPDSPMAEQIDKFLAGPWFEGVE